MKIYQYVLIGILLLGIFLRAFKINDLMGFIGDQGWFYLSAKDLITNGEIPLVGITASYTWLHQGALWTYMLAPVLKIFNFNPVGGAYLSILFGVLAIYFSYVLGKEMFDKRVGLITAFLIATSPLAIIDARFPYHTSPLAFFSVLFFLFAYKYAIGNSKYLIAASFTLGLLYNLELSTMVFWVILGFIVIITRKINIKLFFYSAVAFLIPMIPMIIYDLISRSGFFQTTAFLRFIKLSLEGGGGNYPLSFMVEKLVLFSDRILYLGGGVVSILIIIVSVIGLSKLVYKNSKRKNLDYGLIIVFLWVVLSFLAILAKKDVSGAYIPMLYPGIFLMISILVVQIMEKYSHTKAWLLILVGFIGFSNSMIILSNNYNFSKADGIIYNETLEASREIIEQANGEKYNLIMTGPGAKYDSYDDNFTYLLWWFGNPPSNKPEEITFTIDQKNGKIYISNEAEN